MQLLLLQEVEVLARALASHGSVERKQQEQQQQQRLQLVELQTLPQRMVQLLDDALMVPQVVLLPH